MSPHSYATSNTAVRVALIADKTFDLHKSPLVSLLEVRLSQEQNIELLERAEIDRILQEQKLSITGFSDRDKMLKVGKLLRVDAFLLLAVEGGQREEKDESKLLRVRVTETAHGLRLVDTFEELDSAKLEEIVERITEKVTAILPKITLPPDDAILLGIVDIHRVQLGERYQWLARTIPIMLSVGLSKERRIIMLEREDLKVLHDEKLLAEGEDSEFWASAVLVDGYLRRRSVKDVELKLSLKRASGEEMAEFTVPLEPNEPSMAVEKATNNIIQELLNAPASASWQPKQEAEEFFRQGQLLRHHKRHADALPLLETARALQPDNVYYTGELFENEWDVRFTKGQGDLIKETGVKIYSDLELAQIVSLLVRQIQTEYDKGVLSESYILQECGKSLAFSRDNYGLWVGYFATPVSISTDEIRYINRVNRKIWSNTVKRAVTNWDGSPSRSAYLTWVAWISSDDPNELIENIKNTYSELLTSSEIKEEERFMRSRSMLIFPKVNMLERTHLKGSVQNFLNLWFQYLEGLTSGNDPLIKFSSYVALSLQYGHQNNNASRRYCAAALDVLFNELNSPNEITDSASKYFIRGAMAWALMYSHSMRDSKERLEIFYKIFNPLIEQSDAHNLAIWYSAFRAEKLWWDVGDIKMANRYALLLQKIQTVLKDSKDGYETTQLNRSKYHLTMLKSKFPQLQSPQTPKKYTATMLLTREDWPQMESGFKYTWMLLQENILWIAFAEPDIGLAGIDLAEKKLFSLWQADCPDGTTLHENGKGNKLSGSITGITVNEDASYVAIRSVGLVEFPRTQAGTKDSQRAAQILTEENGLPSISITGMTEIDNKLWIAYGGLGKESGLIVYDPETSDFDTIFCSTLNSTSPFNAGKSYALSFLTPGPDNKLFFIMGERGKIPGAAYPLEQWWGLWSFNTNTHTTTFLWKDNYRTMFLEALYNYGGDFWLQDFYSITQFDPNSEQVIFILGREISKRADPMPQVQKNVFVPNSHIGGGFWWGHLSNGHISLRTAAVHGNSVWARLGRAQLVIIHKDKDFDGAEVIENDILDGEMALRFLSTPYGLVAIGEGTVGLIETK